MDEREPVLVYRERLLPWSEGFVTDQAERLVRYRPWYVGLRRVDGSPVPHDRLVLPRDGVPSGRLARAAFKTVGICPGVSARASRLEPVLVHAHFGTDATQVLPLTRRLRVPLVVTFHGHDVTRDEKDLARTASGRLYARRRHLLGRPGVTLLAVSEYLADRARSRLAPGAHVLVHYCGVDTAEVALAAAAAPRDTGLIVAAGRLVPEKGFSDLIDALPAVRARHPHARVVLIGDGPDRAALHARAERARVGDAVTFAGRLDQRELWAWLGRAAMVAVPSRPLADGRTESYGLVATEAQAAGTAVVATRVGGLPEAVSASGAALVSPRAPAQLAGTIAALLGSPERLRQMGEAGRRWAQSSRDVGRQATRLEEIYDGVTARERTAA